MGNQIDAYISHTTVLLHAHHAIPAFEELVSAHKERIVQVIDAGIKVGPIY